MATRANTTSTPTDPKLPKRFLINARHADIEKIVVDTGGAGFVSSSPGPTGYIHITVPDQYYLIMAMNYMLVYECALGS